MRLSHCSILLATCCKPRACLTFALPRAWGCIRAGNGMRRIGSRLRTWRSTLQHLMNFDDHLPHRHTRRQSGYTQCDGQPLFACIVNGLGLWTRYRRCGGGAFLLRACDTAAGLRSVRLCQSPGTLRRRVSLCSVAWRCRRQSDDVCGIVQVHAMMGSAWKRMARAVLVVC